MTTMEALLALCGSPNISRFLDLSYPFGYWGFTEFFCFILCHVFFLSSVNLMAVLSSLTSIGKQRPIFLSTVVQAFELLHGKCFMFTLMLLQIMLKFLFSLNCIILYFSTISSFLFQRIFLQHYQNHKSAVWEKISRYT